MVVTPIQYAKVSDFTLRQLYRSEFASDKPESDSYAAAEKQCDDFPSSLVDFVRREGLVCPCRDAGEESCGDLRERLRGRLVRCVGVMLRLRRVAGYCPLG